MKKKVNKKKEDNEALFIPAGLFVGMGLGFLYDQLVVGLFIGLGAGFLFFAIAKNFRKKK
ncbi:hypothetical protein KAJ87_02040 [Candidatus Pacearchaeota archaeon]|nr:hypothetical protein [Candidatus Pacearchaeota archaeon]